ncbi:hypothetical protein DB895_13015 [Flavobacterium psychrotolerans]|uniref:Uncharacterized protein n=2 Tax=Flavobacterium psychrotolerans TaxID=2169410 RepID=A0A2U1JFV1_9FLAO|nr:hypothetical protein DB895_13015 [Flavobacterium psychrotolerans]
MIDIDFPIVFILLFIINNMMLNRLSKKYSFFDKKLMNYLYWYHLLFFAIYFMYSIYNNSDSLLYYLTVGNKGDQWPELFYTGTRFISFFAVPFVYLGLSYSSVMLVASWFGYVGFVYAYLYFRESIPINVTVFGRFDLLTLLLFLPNMHFWTASLGKGALIFMGLMVFTQAVKFPQKRIVALLIGGFFIYMVRPHVMLFVLVGVMIGILTGKGKISIGIKLLVLVASIVFLAAASSSILAVAKLENSENVVDDFEQFSDTNSAKLESSAKSGVSMASYPLPLKLFTFWFRPLFVDSPGAIGMFSSVENLIYLLLFAKICNRRFLRFILKAPYMVKMSIIVFLLSSFALTFVMSNLGIIMRQKSMVMYFGFFVIYYFLAQEKWEQMQRLKERNNAVALNA